MTRLAVLADPHCDDYGAKLDPATGLNARWVDTVGMVRWVAADARERGCDALIVAGDLTESRHPAPWRVAQIAEAIATFEGPVILARGNHDGERAGRSIVDVLAAGRPSWRGFSSPGVTLVDDVAIAVLPHVDRHWIRAQPGFEQLDESKLLEVLADQYLAVARGLYVEASALAPLSVLVVHQGLAGGQMSDAQAAFLGDASLVVDTRALADIGFAAILAGHFHKHQVLSESPLIAYAGSPYRTDFGEEHQAKGYLVVDVGPETVDGTTGKQLTAWTFVETPARRFVTLYSLDPVETGDASIDGAIVRLLDVHSDEDPALLRRTLESYGAFEVTEIRRRPIEASAIAGGLSESLTAQEALSAYFEGDPDAEVLVERGREILAEVAG